ncbi:MAG: hypothetical protein ACREJM_15090, partial [Candidatus Saccharimonadales bacterium]
TAAAVAGESGGDPAATGTNTKAEKSVPVNATRPCTDKQAAMIAAILRRKAEEGGATLTEFCKRFSVDKIETLPIDKVNDALAWLNSLA